MSSEFRQDTAQRDFHLTQGWSAAATAPSTVADPAGLHDATLDWLPATVPGTVAQARAGAGGWDFNATDDFDAHDWWYRTAFANVSREPGTEVVLSLDGLATLADVWLNGRLLLRSDNMFVRHEVDVTDLLVPENTLEICFRSLNAALKERRPRPRWKTRIVRNQQIRWFRTTLLGRMLGLSPAIAPVGPWRPIRLVQRGSGAMSDVHLQTDYDNRTGVVTFRAGLRAQPGDAVVATLTAAERSSTLTVEVTGNHVELSGTLRLPDIPPWYPHTHGEPRLYDCRVDVQINGAPIRHELGRIGFRRVDADQADGGFTLRVNGRRVFCRGACWTGSDIVSMNGSAADMERSLRLFQQAGGNMVKVGGTMTYERDDFYRLCDELGILVWQEFMFANMDYPFDDAPFRASARREVEQQLARLHTHPCIAVYCGNSDIELEASMFGLPRQAWRNEFFARDLPEAIAAGHPGVPYVPASPSGGDMPFHVGRGVTHYYAIGAFMQPLARVRGDGVRFAAECMGFAHVPEPEVVDSLFGGEKPMVHDPRWKQRVARHSGYGYDFDDVRDYYLEQVFQVDARALRIHDTARYLALSRVTPGEVLTRVFSEWRRPGSRCDGALMWYWRDFWPGAGQGLIDSRGLPKASYYAARRVWQPITVILTDEGFDGVHAHVLNDTPSPFRGALEMTLLRAGHTVVATGRRDCAVEPGAVLSIGSDDLLNGFFDAAYVYRFGPANHEVVVATLYDADGHVCAQTFHFPVPRRLDPLESAAVSARATAHPDGYALTIESDRLLHAVRIDVPGYLPADNYFHLAPRTPRVLVCRVWGAKPAGFKGGIEALNLAETVRIQPVSANSSGAP